MFNKDGKNIHPTATWKHIYFSEELKAAVNYGYKIDKIIKVHQFSRGKDLFTDFIEHLYELKKIGTDSNDPIVKLNAKLQLNSLYVLFVII